MKERIDIIINVLHGGGAEKVCVNLSNKLIEKKYDVRLIVMDLSDAVYKDYLDKNIKVIHLNKKSIKKSIRSILTYLIREKPKRILTFNYSFAIILVILRKIFHLEFQIIARNMNTLSKQGNRSRIAEFLIKRLYKNVDLLISQSQNMAEDLIKNYGFAGNQIKVINNPISLIIEEKVKSLNYSKKMPKNNKEVLYMGRLVPQKGLEFLLSAFNMCLKIKSDLKLKIVGEGPLRKELEKKAKELGISDRVIFKNFTHDVVECYKDASVTVLSSYYEGFPNVLIESIAVGTPIVAFDCPSGPREIIENGINGFLVEYQNIEDLCKKILMALDYEWDLKLIQKTSQRFTSEKIIDEYIDAIFGL
ncbi:glycosyltransferase [Clostridium sp. BSD9I1]|uniref:glycosyltransferase n=1 Tax=Clostridium sp. BSD9I1 TaxID=2003589 RepID=UPI00164730FB|nr:glycosyltransferase [Clostridium sp. BSD9I1]